MVAVKTHQAHALLRAPDKRLEAFLLFGSDVGLVAERASLLAKVLAARETPPADVIRMDDADLDGDPDRLAVELQTLPMFGGRKVLRAAAGRRINANVLKPLLAGPPLAGLLIVEAGNLRPDEALRALFEKSDRAAALACYADEARDLEAVVEEGLKAAGLGIEGPAREVLVARLGADRALSRAEVDKLALYCMGRDVVTLDDVEAIVGDASEQALDKITMATASGDGRRAVREADRAISAGESAQTIILATQRHFQRLHRLRVQVDDGRSIDDALKSLRPPVHFKVKDQLAAQLRLWSMDRLVRANTGIAAAARTARTTSAIEQPLAERLLLDLARLATAGAPGRPR